MISKCEWIKESGEMCNQKVVEGRSLCHVHIKTQQAAIRNASKLGISGDTQLAIATKEANERGLGEGSLVVLGGDKDKSYKFVRDTATRRQIAKATGWKIIKINDNNGKPVVGQSEIMRQNYEDQVNAKGEIQCGDTVLAEMPRAQKLAMNKAPADKSKRLVGPICKDGGASNLRAMTGNNPDFFSNSSNPEHFREDQREFGVHLNNKKSFLIENNPLA